MGFSTSTVSLTYILQNDHFELLSCCKELHELYNSSLWEYPESFHNEAHINATIEATNSVFQAIKGANNDPFQLISQLDRWNQLHPDTQLTLDELHQAFLYAWATHDLGNCIVKLYDISEHSITIDYLPSYKSRGSEQRSITIARSLLRCYDSVDPKYITIVTHLIEYTAPYEAVHQPFSQTVKIIDQIGGNLFNKTPNLVRGLVREQVEEDSDFTFNPYFYHNFVLFRFPELMPDMDKREQLLNIWNKSTPDEIINVADKMVCGKEWLEKG